MTKRAPGKAMDLIDNINELLGENLKSRLEPKAKRRITSDQVRCDVVDSYAKLMDLVI